MKENKEKSTKILIPYYFIFLTIIIIFMAIRIQLLSNSISPKIGEQVYYDCNFKDFGYVVKGEYRGYLGVLNAEEWNYKTNNYTDESVLFRWRVHSAFSVLNPECTLLYDDNDNLAKNDESIKSYLNFRERHWHEVGKN